MSVIYGLEHIKGVVQDVVLSIGNFDGLHLGHQKILRTNRKIADERSYKSVVLTFEFHPLRVLNPDKAPSVLIPIHKRVEQILQFGIEHIIILHCRRDTLQLLPEDFIGELMECLNLRVIVEGPDFRFGRDRKGDIEYLKQMGEKYGFDTFVVDPVEVELEGLGKTQISSTLIRTLLAEGKPYLAKKCLGRWYEIEGRVVSGSGRGRTLGFPTANLECEDQLLPKAGVYAGFAHIEDKVYPAAISIGPAPTVGRESMGVEVYVLDFEGNLYDKKIRLEFVERLRRIITFEDIGQLTNQVREDITKVREIVGNERPNPD